MSSLLFLISHILCPSSFSRNVFRDLRAVTLRLVRFTPILLRLLIPYILFLFLPTGVRRGFRPPTTAGTYLYKSAVHSYLRFILTAGCPGPFYRFYSLYLRDSTSYLREIIVLVFEFHISQQPRFYSWGSAPQRRLVTCCLYFAVHSYPLRFAGSPTEVGAPAGACFNSYGGGARFFFIALFLHLREIPLHISERLY